MRASSSTISRRRSTRSASTPPRGERMMVGRAAAEPTVQACIPAMLAGDDIIRGNAVVNQIASVS